MSEDKNKKDKLDESLGFDIKDTKKKKNLSHDIVSPVDTDGGTNIDWYSQGQSASASIASTYNVDVLNFEAEEDLKNQYRFVSTIPEVDDAIENIISDSIITNENKKSISLVLDETSFKQNTKKIIQEEYDKILALLSFSTESYNIYRRWYVDGRIAYQMLIDKDNPEDGIQELRYLEATQLRKIKKINKNPNFLISNPNEKVGFSTKKIEAT